MALLTLQRTGEIAVRLALGATAGQIRTLVLRQAGAWTLAGVALGLCCVAAGGRLMKGLLYGLPPTAPLPLAIAVVALTATALLAAWIPARRASAIQPVQALLEL